MIEWLTYVLAIVPGAAYVFAVIRTRMARQWTPSQSSEYVIPLDSGAALVARPKATISPELRAELDQTPEWWDRQFHTALRSSGAIELEYGEVEYVEHNTFITGAVLEPITRPRAILACPCADCKRTRSLGCDPRD